MQQPVILMADDHSMMCKAIRLTLEFHLGYKEMHGVASCSQLMHELNKGKYTHLVLDINLSDGSSLEILPNIRTLYPDLRIIVFSVQPKEVYGTVLKNIYGIDHYISKTEPENEVIHRLKDFFQNKESNTPKPVNPVNPFSTVTPRELELLFYWLQGKGNKEISNALNLQASTISTLKKRLFEKTKTGNILELKELATLYKIV